LGVKDLEDLKKLSMIRSQINEHTVEEIMHTDYPTVGPEDRVSDVLSKMRETGYQEIPVMEGGEYLGMVSYGVILRRKSISLDTKVKTLVRNIPSVSRDTDMTKVAEIVIATNCRQLPVLSKKRLDGIVSRSDLIDIAASIKALKEIKVWEIMTSPVDSVKENDLLDGALDLMRELDIRTVPVVDERRHVRGILGMKEVVANNWKKDDKTVGDKFKAERTQITVESICATAVKTVDWDDSIEDAAAVMDEYGISTVPVVEGDEMVGIITQYDIIELISACSEREMMFVQISGLDDDDKNYTDSIYSLIETEMVKIRKIYKPESLTMHVAKYNEAGGSAKYSISARLFINGEALLAKEVGWDLTKTVGDLMRKLSDSVANIKDTRVAFRKRKR